MEKGGRGFKACYRHEGRAAIANCRRCGRPICSSCLKESMQALLCPECSGVTIARECPDAAIGMELVEVTVDEQSEPATPEVETEVLQGGSVLEVASVRVEEETPAPDVLDVGGARTDEDAEDEGALGGSTGEEQVSAVTFPVDLQRQLARGAVYGLAAGSFTFFLWTVLTALRHEWTQIAVLTAGIIIPWSCFKGTTSKKKLGIPVYRKSPPAAWMALVSVLLLLMLTPIAFLIASRLVYLEDSTRSFRGFVSRYSRAVDIVIMVLAFICALGVPFFLKLGEPP